jgi:tryptophanyl-tRNA synthetase
VNHPEELETILQAGAAKARQRATALMRDLRHAVGLRNLATAAGSGKKDRTKSALPSFKQYREPDGMFYFRFVDAQGRTLLQSTGFVSPKDAGQCIADLRRDLALPHPSDAVPAPGVTPDQVLAALKALSDNGN